MSDSPETTQNASAEDAPMPGSETIREALKEVLDPEIGMNIVELGLVYEIIPNPADRTVKVRMTLTSPGCPLGPEMTSAAYLAVTRLPGVKDCDVELVWDPMWDPMVNPTEEARMTLGIW